MTEHIIKRLRDSKIANLFWNLCEFALADEDSSLWFALSSGEPFRIVGRDGSGGRFCFRPTANSAESILFYVSSEGQAGGIAASLAEGIQIMTALPYWRDCLKFSGGGNLQEMEKTQAAFEENLQKQCPDIDATRTCLYEAFALTPLPDALQSLFRAVSANTTQVIATRDDWPFESLFNQFVFENSLLPNE